MNLSSILGIVLIVVGAIGLAFGGITYASEKHVADIGPIEASVEEQETIPVPPIAGGVAFLAGIGFLLVGRKES